MDKSVLIKLGMQNVKIQTLEEASEVIKYLIKTYSTPEIIKKSGVDKNVLYRLEHKQNVTLDNWLKIKRCFPEVFEETNSAIGEIPIIGQINGNEIVPINPSQPKVFQAPQKAIEDWSPCICFINNQPNAFTGSIRMFSTKGVDHEQINSKCFNRLVIMYPENSLPKFGVLRPNMKQTSWELLDVYKGTKLLSGKVGDKMSWWRYTFTTSLYLMENETAEKYNKDTTENWYNKLDTIY